MERVAVIGTGYVGLVSGTCLADIGHEVVCVDRDAAKIERLRQADIPIYEPGLDAMVERNAKEGRLSFTTSIAEAVRFADIVFLAVGTPPLESGDVDLRQLNSAVQELASHIESAKTIVIKSTVPVGTGRKVERLLAEGLPSGVEAAVVSNPEFLREGSAIHDTFHADRIVIGAADAVAGERIRGLYAPFDRPVLMTDRESAELIKYASNAFLAVKISFINEMANVCDKVGADISLVAQGMGMDKRIGPHFLNAGIGYGGSCFPKDTRAQLRIAEQVEYDFKILRSAMQVNQMQRIQFANSIERALDGSLDRKRIAVLGLAFKPNTDDLRDAPALDIIRYLQEKGAEVSAYDPIAGGKARGLLSHVKICERIEEAVEGADAVAITTDWAEFRSLDWATIARLLRQPLVLDGRNMFSAEQLKEYGIRYISIGRP
ncbi:UDP-glucose dehydrogenase family protein [Paenibacillus koleovorans]|uniref:UDP-glucose dehydrogenase family protein n=1 Tax=Paenibacillus koleovorans TaxID=121608 RepID=UPI000FDB2AD9|nr:UDP-glucose/GDP-mannose dehydrogenase family protein [Paenibacillus koleovorans]